MAPFTADRKSGPIKDQCLLCSTPVYESEVGVHYLGVWVHLSCYRSEQEYLKPETPDRDAEGPQARS